MARSKTGRLEPKGTSREGCSREEEEEEEEEWWWKKDETAEAAFLATASGGGRTRQWGSRVRVEAGVETREEAHDCGKRGRRQRMGVKENRDDRDPA